MPPPPAVTITVTPIGTPAQAPMGISRGADGAMWFTLQAGGKIGRISSGGTLSLYSLPAEDAAGAPNGITLGPDGAMWFTLQAGGKIGRISSGGTFQFYALPEEMRGEQPTGIAPGPDGNLWFTLQAGGKIGRISSGGTLQFFDLPEPERNGRPVDITLGPDGHMWFTLQAGGKIGRISSGGTFQTFYDLPAAESGGQPTGIALGRDGNVWVTLQAGGKIGRISSGGTFSITALTEAAAGRPTGITAGADGHMYFTLQAGGKIGRISSGGTLASGLPMVRQMADPYTLFALPTANGAPTGIALGPEGSLFVTQRDDNSIAKVTPAPPATLSVTVAPSAVTLLPRGTQVFTASVSGGTGAEAIVWSLEGSSDATLSSGGVLTAPSLPQTVWVRATVANGSAYGRASATVVASPPVIVEQPEGGTVMRGAPATFGVRALGSLPLAYQWRKDGTDIVGATGSTLTIPAAGLADAGDYSVLVSNDQGSVLSEQASLYVESGIQVEIITTPATVLLGSAVPMQAQVTGATNPGVHWVVYSGQGSFSDPQANPTQYLAPEVPGSVIVKAYSIEDGAKYGEHGFEVVPAPPQIMQHPVGEAVQVGTQVTFSVVASGYGSLTYQWRKDGNNLPGATASTFVIASAQLSDAGSYDVRVANAGGTTTSQGAILTVTTAPPPITGTWHDGYMIVGGAPVKVPKDLTNVPIRAHVHPPAARGSNLALSRKTTAAWTTFEGSGAADGTWSIPGVPSGTCWLQAGTHYIYTSARSLEWGARYGGRPGVPSAPTNQMVDLYVIQTGAWDSPFAFQCWVPNLGSVNDLSHWPAFHTGYPTSGGFASMWLDWSTVYDPRMIDAAQGDRVWLTKLDGFALNDEPLQRLAHFLDPTAVGNVTMGSGTTRIPTTSGLPMISPAFNDAVGWYYARAQFAALGPQAGHPAPPISVTDGYVYVDPWAVDGHTFVKGGSANLLVHRNLQGQSDFSGGTIPVVNPFPAEWPKVYVGGAIFGVGGLLGNILVHVQEPPTPASPIRPLVTPPRQLRLDGQDIFGAASVLTGSDHVLGFQQSVSDALPATGFRVQVYRSGTAIATLFIPGPGAAGTPLSVPLPPGLLAPGSYVFVVSTVHAGTVDMNRNPQWQEYPYASADAFSSSVVIE